MRDGDRIGSPRSLDDVPAGLRRSAGRLSAKAGRAAGKAASKEKIPRVQQQLSSSEGEMPNAMLKPRRALRPRTNPPEAPNFDGAKKGQRTQATAYFLAIETRNSYTTPRCPSHQDGRLGKSRFPAWEKLERPL